MQCTSINPFHSKIDNHAGSRDTDNHANGESELSVGPGRWFGHRRGRGPRMQRKDTLEQTENRSAGEGRTQSFISDPYAKRDFLLLSQGAAASAQMHSTGSECLSVTLEKGDV